MDLERTLEAIEIDVQIPDSAYATDNQHVVIKHGN
jgi:hypothetical protein